jgi:MFS superfamily sulfate permease-like transporter
MKKNHEKNLAKLLEPKLLTFIKKEGYKKADFFKDPLAGLSVAIVADAMAGTKHKPNTELLAQGPLFFGIAERLVDTLSLLQAPPKVFILRLRHVPIIDAAGLHALEVLHQRLHEQDAVLILSRVNRSIQNTFARADWTRPSARRTSSINIDKALERASTLLP